MSFKNKRAYSPDKRQTLEDLMKDASPQYRRRSNWKAGLRIAFKITVTLFLIAVVIYGIMRLWDKFVENNQDFRLENIQFTTNGQMTERDIRSILNITGEENVLFLDIENWENILSSRPDIARASVHRDLPDTLVIDIEERQPLAWVECAQCGVFGRNEVNGLLTDSSGYLFRYDKNLHERFKNAPVLQVSAPMDGRYHEGEWLEGTSAKRGLSFLKIIPHFVIEGIPPAESIDFPNDWSFVCRFTNGMEITFGLYEHERQLHDLSVIMQHAARTNRKIVSANLIPSRNAPIVFMDKDTEVILRAEIVDDDEQPDVATRDNAQVPPPTPATTSQAKPSSQTTAPPASRNTPPKPATTKRNITVREKPKEPSGTNTKPQTQPPKADERRNTQNNKQKPKQDPPQQNPQPQRRRPVDVPSFNW